MRPVAVLSTCAPLAMAKAEALAKGRRATADRLDQAGGDDSGTRRTEILQTAASLIASSGLRTSLQEIADAAGILPGSLYHHFESKEAILVELIRRYQADLDRIGRTQTLLSCACGIRRSQQYWLHQCDFRLGNYREE